MNIVAFSNGTGSIHWRLQSIANYINTRTVHSMFVTSQWSESWSEDFKPDIVVAQMWRNPKGIDYIHSKSIPVVYEADDSVVGVGKGRTQLMQLDEKMEKQSVETYQKADVITVTTEELAKHYRQFNDNVYVLPNYMDLNWWGQPWKAVNKSMIRVGWMGSTSHHEDLIYIKPVIKKLIKDRNIKFVFCGYGGKRGINGEDLFYDIPSSNKEYVSGVPLEYWPEKSKTLGLDIGIAPLIKDEFNSHKSPIKYYEYACNGVPGVYSAGPVYNDTVKHGVTGYLAKNKKEWQLYLEKLIDSKDLRDQIAINAYQDVVNNYCLADHYQEWINLYERIIYERASRNAHTN